MLARIITPCIVSLISLHYAFAALVPVTEQDADCLRLAGIKNVQHGGVWDNADTRIAGSACASKKYLMSLERGFAGSSKIDVESYKEEGIAALHPAFASCVAEFVKAYKAKYGAQEPVTITSAYRNPCQQIKTCVGEEGPCAVNHTNLAYYERKCKAYQEGTYVPRGGRPSHENGTAVDIWPFTLKDVQKYSTADKKIPFAYERVTRFHRFAEDFSRANPQHAIHFRMGMADRPHLEPQSGVCGYGEHGLSASQKKPSGQSDDASVRTSPNSRDSADTSGASPAALQNSFFKTPSPFMPNLGSSSGNASGSGGGSSPQQRNAFPSMPSGGGGARPASQAGRQPIPHPQPHAQPQLQPDFFSPRPAYDQKNGQNDQETESPSTRTERERDRTEVSTRGTITESFTEGEKQLRRLLNYGDKQEHTGTHTVGPKEIQYKKRRFLRLSGSCREDLCTIIYGGTGLADGERIIIAALTSGNVVYRFRNLEKEMSPLDTTEFRLP